MNVTSDSLIWWTADGWILFLFSLIRIGGLIGTSTWLAPPLLSVRTRIAFACLLALMVTSLHHSTFSPPSDGMLFFGACLREAILGIALGWSLRVLLLGFQLAGQVMSQLGGLSLAELWDVESGSGVPLLTDWIHGLALCLFFLFGGHRQTLHALLSSFHWRPPGRADLSADGLRGFADVIGESFVLALQVALPVVITLLTTTLVLGLVSRAMPQLQLFMQGLPLHLCLLLVVLVLTLTGVAWLMERHLTDGAGIAASVLSSLGIEELQVSDEPSFR